MNWLTQITNGTEVAQAVLILSIISVVGLAISAIKYRGIGMGISSVLFAGLFFGHIGWHIEPEVLDFIREFGLILFVFTIGLQIGPGFFASLRAQGLKINLCAAIIVISGAALTAALGFALGIDPAAAAGLFSGATTNTPSLGAAQQALSVVPGVTAETRAMPALAYAVAYPGGVLGIIICILVLRYLLRVDTKAELKAYEKARRGTATKLVRLNIMLTNANLDGKSVGEIPGVGETGIVISRIQAKDSPLVHVATSDVIVRLGDTLMAVGSPAAVENFRLIVGKVSDLDLMQAPGAVEFRRVIVTHKAALGKSLRQLALHTTYGIVVTRVQRADLEMAATADLRLQFGDTLQVVGDKDGLDQASKVLGNSPKDLGHTNFLPVFAGIALGVVVGLIPFAFPGLPVPVRLGLAGGPLVVAIILSRIGRIGNVVWYMPPGANLALREMGIVLFLACVGLKSGSKFMDTLLSQDGVLWLVAGFTITLVPILVVGIIARLWMKLNYVVITGLVAGSMTDPPALAFANALTKSDAPSISYASVYPLTMLLRILCAQLLILLFAS
ncbi:MAG: putative transporter [Chthoniobacterales bacterium]